MTPAPDSTVSAPASKAYETYLVGSIPDNQKWLTGCPHAAALYCHFKATWHEALIPLPCKRWGCRWCGPRRLWRLALMTENAEPNRLITLTINPSLYQDPRDAYDKTRRQVSQLAKAIRLESGAFEYLRVLEATKAGWPHYHLVARSGFIRQQWLSAAWKAATGAPIVDIRMIRQGQNVCRYVLKYLGKQTSVPWTTRRICFSKNFFVPTEHKKHYTSPFVHHGRSFKGVNHALETTYYGWVAHVYKNGTVLLSSPDDPDPPPDAIS